VNALESVTLETLSTESGTKDFIAVGTTLNRGEDLAVKGAVRVTAIFLFFFLTYSRHIFLRSRKLSQILIQVQRDGTNCGFTAEMRQRVQLRLCAE
jgi:hypothetical protein